MTILLLTKGKDNSGGTAPWGADSSSFPYPSVES